MTGMEDMQRCGRVALLGRSRVEQGGRAQGASFDAGGCGDLGVGPTIGGIVEVTGSRVAVQRCTSFGQATASDLTGLV